MSCSHRRRGARDAPRVYQPQRADRYLRVQFPAAVEPGDRAAWSASPHFNEIRERIAEHAMCYSRRQDDGVDDVDDTVVGVDPRESKQ